MTQKYRPNVSAIVLSSDYPNSCKIFIGKRSDMREVWQFPQGGIDEGESPQQALKRELQEEIGTGDVEILSQYPQWLKYDFPHQVLERFHPFVGQIQKYFLVRLKSDLGVNIHTQKPEFCEYEFVEFKNILERVKHFKKPLYRQVLDHFRQEGFLC